MTKERNAQILEILIKRIDADEFGLYKTNKELAEQHQVSEYLIKKARSIIIEKQVLKELGL